MKEIKQRQKPNK